MFVGASGSKASPYVLLLVRAVQRELTLCEHRASDPAIVSPIFSPNSQNVFFSSDQHGKPAIYRIAVDKLVEATEETPAAPNTSKILERQADQEIPLALVGAQKRRDRVAEVL